MNRSVHEDSASALLFPLLWNLCSAGRGAVGNLFPHRPPVTGSISCFSSIPRHPQLTVLLERCRHVLASSGILTSQAGISKEMAGAPPTWLVHNQQLLQISSMSRAYFHSVTEHLLSSWQTGDFSHHSLRAETVRVGKSPPRRAGDTRCHR